MKSLLVTLCFVGSITSFAQEQGGEEVLYNVPNKATLTLLSDLTVPTNNGRNILVAQDGRLIRCEYNSTWSRLKCSKHLKNNQPICTLEAHDESIPQLGEIGLQSRAFKKGAELILVNKMKWGHGGTVVSFAPKDDAHKGIDFHCGKKFHGFGSDPSRTDEPSINDFEDMIEDQFKIN